MHPEFITATPTDIPLLLRMMADFYAIDAYPFDTARTRANLAGFLHEPTRGAVWLIHLAGEPVGYLVLTVGYSFEYGGPTGLVDELYLEPAVRGRGLGRLAMMFAEREAHRRGLAALQLEVEPHNERGNRLYANLGYQGNQRKLLTKYFASKAFSS